VLPLIKRIDSHVHFYTSQDLRRVAGSQPYASSYIASATGFPEITVPAGIIKGNLPVGVSFLGGYGEDAKVVGFGYAFLGR